MAIGPQMGPRHEPAGSREPAGNSRNAASAADAPFAVEPSRPASPIDVEFARFARTRAPEALAAVFDAAAPRLLLVAMHLCGDAALAEDLVQTVFLQAMRDAERRDPARPVLPWLLGILEHRAGDLHRRRQRRRERSDAAALAAAADGAPGPVRSAADAELRREIATALDAVPSGYREVLTLRLVHGLRAVDIAHAQGVPPATVRARLRRGLEMLRRSLPRSLATPALLALLASEGLRARDGLPLAKDAVVRALRDTLVGSLVPAAAGAALAKWLAAAGAIAAVALACALSFAPGTSIAAPPLHDAPPAAATATAAASPSNDEPGEGASPRESGAVPRVLAADPRATTVRGRIVDDLGAPIGGAAVTVSTWHDGSRGEAPTDWSDPAPAVAGVDGSFALQFVPPRSLGFEFVCAADRHVPTSRIFESLRQGIDVDLGEVTLARGTPVALHLTVAGQPPGRAFEVRGALLAPAGEAVPVTERVAADATAFARSDVAGLADLGVLQPGQWRFTVDTVLLGGVVEVQVLLQDARVDAAVSLQLPPPDRTVTGRLVDERGLPVPDLELRAPVPGNRMHGYWTACTAQDGSFVFALSQPWEGSAKFHFELPHERADLEWIDDGGEFAWGTQDLHLVVRRRAPCSLRVSVVDAATGRPVESFGASCWPDHWRRGDGGGPDLRRVAPVAHAGGVQQFAGLTPGPWRVSVWADPPYAERAEVPIEIAEGQRAEVRVELALPATLTVTTVDAERGEPIAGVEVALAKVLPEDRLAAVDLSTYRNDLDRARRGGGTSTGTNVLVLDRGRSDRDGTVTLRASPDTPALVAITGGDACIATIVPVGALPAAGARLRLPVVAAGSVHGVLRPSAFVQRFGPEPSKLAAAANRHELPDPRRFADDWPQIELNRIGEPERPFRVHVDAEGRFALGALPPGRYEVRVAVAVTMAERSRTTASIGPLTTVDVVAGAVTALDVDVAAHVPGRATARFFVDGAPWHGLAGFHSLDGGRTVTMATDGDGVATSFWLLPGRYVPYARIGENGPTRDILGVEPFVVGADAQVQVVATLRRRVVAFVLRERDGAPLAGRRVVPESLDHPEIAYQWRGGVRTDADGRAVIDPAPPGRIALRAFADGQDPSIEGTEPAVPLGELGPAAGADGRPIEVRWP